MKLSFRNFFRNRRVSLIAVAVVTVLSVFLLIFSNSIASYQEELAESYRVLSATARIKAAKSGNKPALNLDAYQTILDSGFVAEYTVMADHRLMGNDVLRGLNDPKADPSLRDRIEDTEWVEGYDVSIFTGAEMVCLVPYVYELEYGDTWDVQVGGKTYTLSIAGTYGWFSGYEDGLVYYCPVDTLKAIYEDAGEDFTYSGFEMELQNLPKLDAFKELLRQLALDSGDTRVVINDSRLQSITSQLKRQIRLLETLLPVLLALVAGVSFGLSFLLLRGRKREAAILRSLGMRRSSVFAALEGEIALQALLGLLIGAGIGFSTLGAQALQPKYMAALLICYLLGGGFAAWKISGINVFNIMTARE